MIEYEPPFDPERFPVFVDPNKLIEWKAGQPARPIPNDRNGLQDRMPRYNKDEVDDIFREVEKIRHTLRKAVY